MHLASWGYVVLQYDTPALHVIADTVEASAAAASIHSGTSRANKCIGFACYSTKHSAECR